MFRITRERASEQETILRVDGRLDAGAVPELHALVEMCRASARITLSLAGLTSVDQAGKACLIDLRQTGCRLVRGSLYINRLLQEDAP